MYSGLSGEKNVFIFFISLVRVHRCVNYIKSWTVNTAICHNKQTAVTGQKK
jgi:hypothetical protein